MKFFKIVMSLGTLVLMLGVLAVEGMAHEWIAPEKAASVKNPVALNDESLARGKKAYIFNCAGCHGDNIEGLDAGETGLGKHTPNLKNSLSTHSDGDLFWKIKEGRDFMPSFNDNLHDNQIWTIINYIRSEAE